MLDESGTPEMVQQAKIIPPRSQVGAITPEQRRQIISSSVLAGHYEKTIDRESAYEKLQARAGVKAEGAPEAMPGASVPEPAKESFFKQVVGSIGAVFKPTIGPRGGVHDSMATTMAKSAVRAAGSTIGRQIVRGMLGGILGGRR
jgi:hypothetical protein